MRAVEADARVQVMSHPLLTTNSEARTEPEQELPNESKRMERCVQIDFLRTLCVLFVCFHHAELRLDGVYFTEHFIGYALSCNLWVLWYLVIMSGMLFMLSSRPIGQYLLRMLGIMLFGMGCNTLGIVISWHTNPSPAGGRWSLSFDNILYQVACEAHLTLPELSSGKAVAAAFAFSALRRATVPIRNTPVVA